MSYAAFSTHNPIGRKNLRVLPNLGHMGLRIPGPTQDFIGIKNLRTLPNLGAMGQGLPDLIDAGVDPGVAQTLIALGASPAQLEAVIVNPDSPDAAVALLNQLTGNAPAPGQPVTSAANYPMVQMQQQSVSVAGIDLTEAASWLSVSDQIQTLGTGIQQVAAAIQANSAIGSQPGVQASTLAGDVSALQAAYQSILSQWNGLFSQAQSNQTVTMPDGTVLTIQQAGLDPRAIYITAGIIAGAATIIAALHTANVYLGNVQARIQAPVQQTASATQQSLISAINSTNAQAATATNPATKAALLQQSQTLSNQLSATGYVPPGSTANPLQSSLASGIGGIGTFLTANWPWVLGGVLVLKLGPALIKKI